jgi:protein-tyrosine-phosphatase
MHTKLIQLEERIKELDLLWNEVSQLGDQFFRGAAVQPQFSMKGESWVRGARELLVQHNFSGLNDFDQAYNGEAHQSRGIKGIIHRDRADFGSGAEYHNHVKGAFKRDFQMARGLLGSVVDEMKSRELPIKTALSLALAADELDTAHELLDAAKSNESLVRAAGVVARVALERHLFTLAQTRKLTIELNPPTKKKATASDVLATLSKSDVITAIQRSELEGLFTIANHCAHPKEVVTVEDVKRLIERSRLLAATID